MEYRVLVWPMLALSLVSGCSGGGNTYYVPATGGGAGTPGTGGSPNSGGSAQGGSGAGSGGDAGSSAGSGPGGSAGAGGTGGAQIGCASELVIDDLEDGDSVICPARSGGWYVAVQEGSGTALPSPGTVITATPIADRAGSSYAMSFSGSGFDGPDHWAILALSVNGNGPYDASAFSGIRFWGKSTSGGSVVLRVAFPTLASTAQTFAGTCVPVNDLQCGDHYLASRTLANVWQQYEVYFPNDLAQVGWGVPVAKDLAYLMSIEFGYQSSDNANAGSFAFIIDDVTFY